MLARITVPYQFLGTRIEILLADLHTLTEGRRRWMVQNPDPATRSTGNLDTIET